MRILSAFRLSTTQKQIIAKITAAENPKLAGDALVGDRNQVESRNILMRLGIINFTGGNASLTDEGMSIAKEGDIIDDTGELTDSGRALIGAQQAVAPQPEAIPAEAPSPPMESTLPIGRGSLLKELINQ